jgi:hypothetical protein
VSKKKGADIRPLLTPVALLQKVLRSLKALTKTQLKLLIILTVFDVLGNRRSDYFRYGLVVYVRHGLELFCLLGIQANRHCLLVCHVAIMRHNGDLSKWLGSLVAPSHRADACGIVVSHNQEKGHHD